MFKLWNTTISDFSMNLFSNVIIEAMEKDIKRE